MITTRFAPSPTGFLHLGGARTALFNWLLARKNGGRFVLRIEDTDEARSTEASVQQIIASLRWLGMDWDEGPYFQSARLDIYRAHLALLAEKDAIYPAFETMAELEAARQLAMSEKRTPIYDGPSRHYSREEARRRIAAGERFVWRFRVPKDGTTEIPETLMSAGGVKFPNADIDDFAITRPGQYDAVGMPLYNFCCVIDDALMKISHVIRGVEHLSNTPKQMLLYKAFGYTPPTFTHLPLILKNKKKMSKRDAEADPLQPVSVSARQALGYLPDATVNFLALLGWSDPAGLELFTPAHLENVFSLDRLGRSNANFDENKYLHTNAWYIRQMPLERLTPLVIPYLEAAGFSIEGREPAWIERIVGLEHERCRLLGEFPDALRFFFEPPSSYDPKAAEKFLLNPRGQMILDGLKGLLATLASFDCPAIEGVVRRFAADRELKIAEVSQPLRVALTGRSSSPGLFEVMEALGRDETLKRLERATTPASGR